MIYLAITTCNLQVPQESHCPFLQCSYQMLLLSDKLLEPEDSDVQVDFGVGQLGAEYRVISGGLKFKE